MDPKVETGLVLRHVFIVSDHYPHHVDNLLLFFLQHVCVVCLYVHNCGKPLLVRSTITKMMNSSFDQNWKELEFGVLKKNNIKKTSQ